MWSTLRQTRAGWLRRRLVWNLPCFAALPSLFRLALDRILVLAAREHGLAHTHGVAHHVKIYIGIWPVWHRTVVLVMRIQNHMILHAHLVRHNIWIVFLTVVCRKLVFVLKERVLWVCLATDLVWARNIVLAAWSGRNIASHILLDTALGRDRILARWINFKYFLATRVHLGCAWIRLARELIALSYWIGKWVLVAEVWSLLFILECRFDCN